MGKGLERFLIRTENWKYIEKEGGRFRELYDLNADRLVTGTRFMADYYIDRCGLKPEKAVIVPNYIGRLHLAGAA